MTTERKLNIILAIGIICLVITTICSCLALYFQIKMNHRPEKKLRQPGHTQIDYDKAIDRDGDTIKIVPIGIQIQRTRTKIK